MSRGDVDAHPIKSLVSWLGTEAWSIPAPEKDRMERTMSELNDLKSRIASGEYRLDAHAIAEAMFGRADRDLSSARGGSEMLEAGEPGDLPGGVDQL